MTDRFISEVVPGKSFLDVGVVWSPGNERLTAAHRHGAVRLGALDQVGFESPMWDALDDRLAALGAPYERYSMEVGRYEYEPWDVVHCAGVLYHHPSPVALLQKLYGMTGAHLILGTVVATSAGGHPLVPGSMVFLPGVPEAWVVALRQEWRDFLGDRAGDIFDHDVRWDADNLYHWWWLFTEGAVLAMCEAVGFRVVSGHTEGRILTLLLDRPG